MDDYYYSDYGLNLNQEEAYRPSLTIGDNPHPECVELWEQYTNNGTQELRNSQIDALKRCKYTNNLPDCQKIYDEYSQDIPLSQRHNFDKVIESLPAMKKELNDCTERTSKGLMGRLGRWAGSTVGYNYSDQDLLDRFKGYESAANQAEYNKGQSSSQVPLEDREATDPFEIPKAQAEEKVGQVRDYATETVGQVGEYVTETVGQVGEFAKQKFLGPMLRFIVYLFLITQILIEVFGTSSEIFGIKTSFATRIVVLVLVTLQIIFAGGVLRFGYSSLSVGVWMGIVYFGTTFVGAIVSGVLSLRKIQNKNKEESKIFDIIAVVAMGIQAVVSLIFGIIFLVKRDENNLGQLYMYAVLIIALTELIVQMLSMVGLK